MSEFCHLRSEQVGQHLGFLQRDQHRNLGVAQNACVAAEMVFNLRQPRRRIDRHWNAPGEQDAEKAIEVVCRSGKHQACRLPRIESQVAQRGGHFPGLLPEDGIADLVTALLCLLATFQQNVQPIRVGIHVPLQRFG